MGIGEAECREDWHREMEKSYTEVVWICGEKIPILHRKTNAGDGTSWGKIPHQRQIDCVNRGTGALGATEDEVHDISRSVTDVATEHLKGLCKEFIFLQKSAFTMEVGGWVQVCFGICCCWNIIP